MLIDENFNFNILLIFKIIIIKTKIMYNFFRF